MFDDDVSKWRSKEIRRVCDARSDWTVRGVVVAAEILQHVQVPAAEWDVYETPSQIASNQRAIEVSRAAIGAARYDQLSPATFGVTADIWLTCLAVERAPQRRALAIEIINPYEPYDCEYVSAPAYFATIGDLTRLKLAFSLDLRQTGLWFASALG
jgi:hypothetical protein